MSYVELIPSIRSLLLAEPEVVALVNTRISTDVLPQGASMPAVILNIVSDTGNDCLHGTMVGTDTATMQVDCYGITRSEAEQVWQTVRSALVGYRGVSEGTSIQAIAQSSGRQFLTDRPDMGSDSWRYRSVQDFSVTYRSVERV